jgi:RsiW-degrading membrane proteinase PrsW (M82 family)
MFFCNSNICLLGLAILVAKFIMLFTMTFNYGEIHKDFMTSLDDGQKKIYIGIIDERRKIYLKGYIFGIILSVSIVLLNKFLLKNKISNILCWVVVISCMTTYFYYILSPKSKYMLEVLNKDTQIKNWLKVYKSMQSRFHFSYLLGVVAVLVLNYSIC